ncbi:MAG: hypothetical protein H6607_10520 [Flavobacteriales bacterium]|nr:hypothetical protein [Flavobacteriales bacterium]
MKLLKYLLVALILLITVLICSINVRLKQTSFKKSELKEDIVNTLNFLENQINKKNLGQKMQQIFPEGYVFTHAVYGVSWCQLALAQKNDSEIRNKALHQAILAYKNLETEYAKMPFSENLDPNYGIFYVGWKNYLLSKIFLIDTVFAQSDIFRAKFEQQCHEIADAAFSSQNPYPQSYAGHSWPSDAFVAVASLSNYDKIFGKKFRINIDEWLANINERLDAETGMIPHKVDFETGKCVVGTRGCSIALILRMLAEIDSDLATEQYLKAKEKFMGKTVGLPSVREYPKGKHGKGDIDSGPVIFGVGFTATIMMVGVMAMLDDSDIALQQYQTINAFGFAQTSKKQKKYLLGKLPIADAFIVWGKCTVLSRYNQNEYEKKGSIFLKFHLISALILFFIWAGYFAKPIIRWIKNPKKM